MDIPVKSIDKHASYEEFEAWYEDYATKLVHASCGPTIKPDIYPVAKDELNITGHHEHAGRMTSLIEVTFPTKEAYANQPPLYWIMRCVENIQHECAHASDPYILFAKMDDVDAVYASLLEMVAGSNDEFSLAENGTGYRLANYSHDVNEIRADFRAMVRTKDFLVEHFFPNHPQVAKAWILNLAGDKIHESKGHYGVCYGMKSRPATWEDFINAAEFSVKKAQHVRFVYDWKKYQSEESLALCLATAGVTRRLATLHAPTAHLQIFRSAVLLNEFFDQSPLDTYFNLEQIDLSPKNFWNPDPFAAVRANQFLREKVEKEVRTIDIPLDGTPYEPDKYDYFGY